GLDAGLAAWLGISLDAWLEIWLAAGASKRSVCTSLLAVGRISTAAESLRSSVATVFAFAVVAIAVAGAGGAFEAVSSAANCSAVCGVLDSSAAAGSALG